VVISTGTGEVDSYPEYDDEGYPQEALDDFFRPKYFEPSLELIALPEDCPGRVSKPLRESFRLFFCAPNAAANCVRIAVEELLSDLGVKRFALVGGKRRPISLHQRITLIPPKFEHLKEMILAVKWLGNAGSHATGDGNGALSADDVLDSYEFAEHIVQEIYSSKTKTLFTLAKKVNKKKGPLQ